MYFATKLHDTSSDLTEHKLQCSEMNIINKLGILVTR